MLELGVEERFIFVDKASGKDLKVNGRPVFIAFSICNRRNVQKYLFAKKKDIAAAKAKGKHMGCPQMNLNALSKEVRVLLVEHYLRWEAKEITGVAFAKLLGLRKNTFYKIVDEYKREVEAD